MHTPLHMLEAHVQAVNSQHLREALQAEQIRLASGKRKRPTFRFVANVRNLLGGAMIATGERLRLGNAQAA